jgi:hypothetical protein
MAYLQGRAGLMRSGVTYAGLSFPKWRVFLNGIDQTANRKVRAESFLVSEQLDGGQTTCTFSLKGLTPTLGHDVKVIQTAPSDYLFGGTLLEAQAQPYGSKSGEVIWHCIATGYIWLMDRYALVTKQYIDRGVNAIAADIIATGTNGGFRIGYIPSSLGNLSIDFRFESVSSALSRLAQAADAYWEVTPDKVVNMYQTYPDVSLPAVTHTAIDLETVDYQASLVPVRTRVVTVGQGSLASLLSPAGGSVVHVDDLTPFTATGGSAISGQSLFTYGSLSAASGPGQLLGCAGIDYDVQAGDDVRLLEERNNSTAQTALAAALGGGLSGVAVYFVDDPAATSTEALKGGDRHIALYGESDQSLTYDYRHPVRRAQVGRVVTASLTQPFTVAGTFRVQVVESRVSQRASAQVVGEDVFQVQRRISASKTLRTLTQLLGKVA